MIHIVTNENRASFHWELLEMHRHRKAVFIDELGWSIECSEGLEIDQFDRQDSIYLLDLEAQGALRCSVRLLPTDTPHLMSEVFSHLCSEGAPRNANIWEASRFCPAPSITDPAERRALLVRMIAGVIEAGLLFGVEHISLVTTTALSRTSGACGWRMRPLGERQQLSGASTGAYLAPVSTEALRRVRVENGLAGPISRYMPAQRRAA